MAKKTLLTESEFMKFMKLARLEPLAAEKAASIYGEGVGRMPGMREPGMRGDKEGCKCGTPGCPDCEPGTKDDELAEDLASLFEEEDEMPDVEDEEVTVMEPVEDEPMSDDEMDMPDVEMADDEMAGGDMADLRGEIESALENLLGLIDQGLEKADMGDVMDVEADDEGDAGLEGDEGGDTEMGAALPAPEEEVMDDELMEAITRRVARRLQKESKVDAKSDLIAERIMKRLKNL